jgi:hypothetical protein
VSSPFARDGAKRPVRTMDVTAAGRVFGAADQLTCCPDRSAWVANHSASGSSDPTDRRDVTPGDPGDLDHIAALRCVDVEPVSHIDADVTYRRVQSNEISW